MSERPGSMIKKSLIFLIFAVVFAAAGAFVWEKYEPDGDNNIPVKYTSNQSNDYSGEAGVEFASQYDTSDDEDVFESPFVAVAERLKPSVVNISTEKLVNDPHDALRQFEPFRDFFEQRPSPEPRKPRSRTATGTGVIISKDGHVLTNNHVVADAQKITVELINGEEREAEVVGSDPETDLALISIGKISPDYVARLGDSDKIRIGDWAIAMGNAMGLEWTLSVGVISAKGRSDLLISGGGPLYQDFIQTDASINFGNSGGPLANIRGEIIGINTAINASGNDIGFAIPINLAKEVVRQLRDDGHVTRGFLGMVPVELDPLKREALGLDEATKGIFVESIQVETPADVGGLQASDVIVEVDGKTVDDVADFRFRVARHKPDEKMELTVLRHGKKKKLDFVLANRADYLASNNTPAQPGSSDWMGIHTASLASRQARNMDMEVERGVLIIQVIEDSPASGKLRKGDVIVKLNQDKTDYKIDSIDDWRKATETIGDTDKAVLVMFYRDGKGSSRFVAFKK
ncbi:MAG: trypsin-like peptidase domain-containing protein [Candidatus Electryonea clarkiae]|nr:trypsin-like peptidase domain-containing protein [Candidatus Electryonea clarkiae]MDP8286914.1 trypsin-like peptidase domain-containing protein [Candidatus Electryonea clarkiae]